MPRRNQQFRLFGCRDTRRRTTKGITRAHSDFDKHQRVIFGHDEIDLSETATVIPLHQRQPLLLQVGCRDPFRFSAFRQSSHASITGLPELRVSARRPCQIWRPPVRV